MVVVVDALDECSDTKSAAEFVDILAHICSDRLVPLQFLLTSQAEDHIRQEFSVGGTHSATYFLSLEDFNADIDICSFLESHFMTIYEQKLWLLHDISQLWPLADKLTGLVKKSSDLFIFASTLVDFVANGKGAPPHQKLKNVLKLHTGLDPFYTQVLSVGLHVGSFCQVLAAIILLLERLPVASLACLFQLESTDMVQAMLRIQSIIKVPENNKPILLHHTSLREFLIDKQHSKSCFINPPLSHASIAVSCLQLMKRDLRQDTFPTADVQDYACLNWYFHLDATIIKGGLVVPSLELAHSLKDFLMSQSCEAWVNVLLY
jgi:hypothetical protein